MDALCARRKTHSPRTAADASNQVFPLDAGETTASNGQIMVGMNIKLPMREGQRSLNLSNAVAVTVFEAWRQHGFAGASPAPGLPPQA